MSECESSSGSSSSEGCSGSNLKTVASAVNQCHELQQKKQQWCNVPSLGKAMEKDFHSTSCNPKFPRRTPNTLQTRHRRIIEAPRTYHQHSRDTPTPASMSRVERPLLGCDSPEQSRELQTIPRTSFTTSSLVCSPEKLQSPLLAQELPASGKSLSLRQVSQLPTPLRRTLRSLPPSSTCRRAAIGVPSASTPEKEQRLAYRNDPSMRHLAGTAVISPTDTALVSPAGQIVSPGMTPTSEKGQWCGYSCEPPSKKLTDTEVVSPTVTAVVSPAGQNDSPGISQMCACSTVHVLAAPPVAKPHAAQLMTRLPPAESFVAVDVLAAPPVDKPHGAPFLTELLPAELSAADNPQGSISRASFALAGASPILDSSDSRLSGEGLETSEKSKPVSEKEELVALREGLAELYVSIAEHAGDKRCETFLDSHAVSVLERGLLALERVWVSEMLSCA